MYPPADLGPIRDVPLAAGAVHRSRCRDRYPKCKYANSRDDEPRTEATPGWSCPPNADLPAEEPMRLSQRECAGMQSPRGRAGLERRCRQESREFLQQIQVREKPTPASDAAPAPAPALVQLRVRTAAVR